MTEREYPGKILNDVQIVDALLTRRIVASP